MREAGASGTHLRTLETYAARVNNGKAVHIFTKGSNIPWCTAGTRRNVGRQGEARVVRPTDEIWSCKRCLSMIFKG